MGELTSGIYEINQNKKFASTATLRHIIYILVASRNLGIRQDGRARILWVTDKLKQKWRQENE